MNQQPSFCTHCGQPLRPGSSFCTVCGSQVATAAPTVASPAATPPAYPALQAYPAPPTYAAPQAPVAKPHRKPSLIVILIGVLLLVIGLRGPLAMLLGQTAAGKVTSVQQVISSTSDRMDYNYEINYEFYVDGKKQTGSYNKNKVYNVSTLPKTGTVLSIKYLPFLPAVNVPANQGGLGFSLLFVCGLGVALIVLGASGRAVIRSGRRR